MGSRDNLQLPRYTSTKWRAERKNYIVVEMKRRSLQIKGLKNSYWANSVDTKIYILNGSPTNALDNMTP